MFLTEIKMRDADAARFFPANPYDWHKVVWSFFPERADRDFLYRVDYDPRGIRLMLLSAVQPVFAHEGESYFFRCREIPESFLTRTLYRFQVRVNPTRRIKNDARTGMPVEKGIRVPVIGEQELLAWLERKGKTGGFSLPGLSQPQSEAYRITVMQEARLNFQKKGYGKAHHASVQFSGILQVENTDLFKKTFQEGIGSAKSFGFGLLMLQPLDNHIQ
ncbi:MAG: type I-E CRISPR-associated protein Cas6/Cse3/CasE [Akkermansia sp.]|nr:type I-E CRISPR-associated protein Cas6/Cse3/CasE [Akkermansia sp.]